MKVVVEMITYNHEGYIRQAIESVVNQQTNFDFRIYIFEDCSTDDTANICRELQAQYPDKIYLHANEKNIGIQANARLLHEACYNSTAEYVAICEGDDYWSDPTKLQQQYDFMIQHPEVVFCGHRTQTLRNGVFESGYYGHLEYPTGVYSLDDYIEIPFFHTSSFFFSRKAMVEKLPEWYCDVYGGDFFAVLLAGRSGKIGFIDKYMSVYRIINSSATFNVNYAYAIQNMNHHLEEFNKLTDYAHKNAVDVARLRGEFYNRHNEGYARKLSFLFKNLGFFSKYRGVFFDSKILLRYLLPNPIIKLLGR